MKCIEVQYTHCWDGDAASKKDLRRSARGRLTDSNSFPPTPIVDGGVGKPGGNVSITGPAGIDEIRNCDGGSEIYACFLPTVTLNSAFGVIHGAITLKMIQATSIFRTTDSPK
jgi:hypothetical protein